MQDDLKKYTWISPHGTEVIFPWDLERYIFTPHEYANFKIFMDGQTMMMIGDTYAYYPSDIIRFAEGFTTD